MVDIRGVLDDITYFFPGKIETEDSFVSMEFSNLVITLRACSIIKEQALRPRFLLDGA